MIRLLRATILIFGCLLILTGVVYPAFITLIGQIFFQNQANGSFVFTHHGVPQGSILIAQSFEQDYYFHGRPSLINTDNRAISIGRNLGQANHVLLRDVIEKAKYLLVKNQGSSQPIPMDIVTVSGSNLDPHITPESARFQVPRIARSRQVSEDELLKLIEDNTIPRTFFILGEPRINVLQINLVLDQLYPIKP